MHFWNVIVALDLTQENSTGHLTPYCLALQWHDYTSLLKKCVFCLSLEFAFGINTGYLSI